MNLSLCERAIDVVLDRLCGVKQGNGFRTDAGLHVFDSAASIDESQLPCFIVFESQEATDEGAGNHNSMAMTLSLQVCARVKAGQDDTGKMLRQLKADAKKALLINTGALIDASSGGRGFATIIYKGAQAEPRENGATTEGVILNFDVNYKEGYGDPYASR